VIVSGRINGRDARTRAVQWDRRLAGLLAPALAVMILLFGGGLALGALQALGHLPGAGMAQLTTDHFIRVLTDPDFLTSLGLTFHIALTSTVIAAVASVLLALALTRWAVHNRLVQFVLQVPLTVPHLVVAVSMLFLLAPAGLAARLAAALGLIASPGQFPLLVNDRWAVGILLVYIWKEIPFITLMVLSVLQNAGGELIEVGRTLKAGPWQRFRFILLPVIAPSLAAACLIVFAFTFGAFEVPYLLGRTYPMSLPVWAYRSYMDVDLAARPEGIAIGLIIALVVMGAVALSAWLNRMAQGRETGR
jgi:putative spermidine/putrescine transport system permease protein